MVGVSPAEETEDEWSIGYEVAITEASAGNPCRSHGGRDFFISSESLPSLLPFFPSRRQGLEATGCECGYMQDNSPYLL
jgi:hypothetical protein